MNLHDATILVTGGAGFIGSHLVEDLVKRGMHVRVYDDFSSGLEANIQHLADRIEVIRGDILDFDSLLRAMDGCDYVSHQAAQLEIFRSIEDPHADLRINTVGTLNVLRAAERCQVSKVINASSACIYGQVDGPTREEHLPVPNWAYGVSKLAAERYGTIYHRSHDLPVVSLRYAITYGEREWYRRVLTIFIKRVLQGEAPVVFGGGEQIRDFLYVGDLVDLHYRCLVDPTANGQSYNVGTGIGTTVSELATIVAQASGKNLTVIHEQVPEGSYSALVPDKKRNPAELKVMLLDCAKAERELGWKARTPLAEGVRREMEWAAQHPDRWGAIHYTPVSV